MTGVVNFNISTPFGKRTIDRSIDQRFFCLRNNSFFKPDGTDKGLLNPTKSETGVNFIYTRDNKYFNVYIYCHLSYILSLCDSSCSCNNFAFVYLLNLGF